MSTRQLIDRRIATARGGNDSVFGVQSLAFTFCVALPLIVLYVKQPMSTASQQPKAIVESVRPISDLFTPPAAAGGGGGGGGGDGGGVPSSSSPSAAAGPRAIELTDVAAEHQSQAAMAVLNRERAKAGGAAFASAFKVYRPVVEGTLKPGGDLDDPSTLARVVPSAAADGEVMILCIGGSGSMRAGMNLVMNFRQMGLYHMLILAPQKSVCDDLWGSLPSLACVWWPSQFTSPRPHSLYNTLFSRYALSFFEARKVLLERLVLDHRLNVLHLDADTVWFANPYPYFKTLYKEYSLIIQTDNPFVNAGIMYVQNVRDGDAAAWVLQELNRRIARFTYHPESVKQLPNSAWSSAPHFANADEQANLNDIVTTCLIGKESYSAGVEFYEARFKRDRQTPRDPRADQLMRDGAWTARMLQGDVQPARRQLRNLGPERQYEPIVHLCKPSLWVGVQTAQLAVPRNASAPRSRLLLAPEWLFSHFPYGAFFPSFRECHADSWRYAARTPLEQRLCMPSFRVPVVMVHMAGLRNGQWGRRGVMRALGVWNDAADTVATGDWVSSRTKRLLVVDGGFVQSFQSMAEFDRFACRLLLLGLLLGRRAVIPSMPCSTRWAQSAMEPRHLRGLEVGCGRQKQCVWLPMPHYKEAWCSGVDFLYSIDYEVMVDRGEVRLDTDVAEMDASSLRFDAGGRAGRPAELRGGDDPRPRDARVLKLTSARSSGDPLEWLPLTGFSDKSWSRRIQSRVAAALTSTAAGVPAALGLNASQLTIVKDCMHSLATSRD
jgi:hypothetical protein